MWPFSRNRGVIRPGQPGGGSIAPAGPITPIPKEPVPRPHAAEGEFLVDSQGRHMLNPATGAFLIQKAGAAPCCGGEACCLPGGVCDILPCPECEQQDGVCLPAGVSCDPNPCIGACCKPDCTCIVTSAQDCQAQAGVYLGPDVDCVPNPCTGACCLPSGACIETCEADCLQQGGYLQGPGISCTPDPCVHACCLSDMQCVEETCAQCEQYSGTCYPQLPGCIPNLCGITDCGACDPRTPRYVLVTLNPGPCHAAAGYPLCDYVYYHTASIGTVLVPFVGCATYATYIKENVGGWVATVTYSGSCGACTGVTVSRWGHFTVRAYIRIYNGLLTGYAQIVAVSDGYSGTPPCDLSLPAPQLFCADWQPSGQTCCGTVLCSLQDQCMDGGGNAWFMSGEVTIHGVC